MTVRTVPRHGPLGRTHPFTEVTALCVRDIQVAVCRARDEGTAASIRSTGLGTRIAPDGGVVIDVSRLSDVSVDPVSETVTVGGGATWDQVVATTGPLGFMPPVPTTRALGVAGYTLGGGLGRLARAEGFACDHLVQARVVTGEGRTVTAAPDSAPDLLWALRGGRHGLGVVIHLVLRLQPITTVRCGTLVVDLASDPHALERWIEWTHDAPAVITSSIVLRPARGPAHPSGPTLAVQVASTTTGAAGKALTGPLQALGRSAHGDIVDCAAADPGAPTRHPITTPVRRGALLAHVDAALAQCLEQLLADAPTRLRGALAGIELRHLDGAGTVLDGGDAGAVGHRDIRYAIIVAGSATAPLEHAQQAVEETFRRLDPWLSDHLTPGWINDPRSAVEAARAWPVPTAKRLDTVRRLHDPAGIFLPDRNVKRGDA